jgi:glucose/arabinose dehydrogenase
MRVQSLCGSVLVMLTLAQAATPATLPTGFTEALVANGLASPTAMQIAPDGRLFVCEQGGRLRIIKDGTLLPQPFVTVTVNAEGERGLLGVAFDPDFTTNRYVYVYYTTPTPAMHNRISRFTANGDIAVAGSETVIFELDTLSASNHNGGALAFGPDGKLYAAVGENAETSNAQSLTNVLGKILRINKDGTIPTDNPFYTSTTGRNRAIWALGLRNPFTFAFNPGRSEMFINDVGQDAWEEINEGVSGANYGWPYAEGPTQDPRFTGPLYAYSHSGDVCAITGGAFYSPASPRFPSEYFQDYFFADHCAGWIRRLDPASGGGVTTFATGLSFPVDLKVADDGRLYYLIRGTGTTTGAVYRVDYGAAAPTITSQPTSQSAAAGVSVTFSVRASGTPPLSYQWQRNGANVLGATTPDLTMVASSSENGARFRAVVTNGFGSVLSNEAVLTVTGNQRPTPTIVQPAAGTLYSGGSVIFYSGTASDPEDGTLPASSFTWHVDFHHDSHTHPFLQPTSGTSSGSFTIPTTGETSPNVWYRIYLTVRDSGGLTQVVYRDILPRKVQLTLATNPAGLPLRLDGQPVASPIAFESVVGMQRTLEAAAVQTSGNTNYEFVSWSDGGAARHDISTPGSNTVYTASYRVSTAVPSLLRAAFGFEEASGPIATDSSTYGHIGTIVGAAWTTGQIGGALAFDGSDDRATVGANSALDLTATGTVEAWVRVDTLGRWHGIVAKGNSNNNAAHNYALEIDPRGMVVCMIGNGSAANGVHSTTAVSAGQFYHLACTWDGSAVQLYINGEVNSATTPTIVASANSAPLFIGQYGGDVDRMDGVIDEVRIYSVALSAAQIQTDMTTAIATGPGDTVAPGRSNGLPTGTLAAGTTQATLRLTTDENATCRYGTVAGTAYTSLPTQFTTTGGTAHATTVSGLANGRSYTYYVRCRDSAGNANATDFAISFSVAPGALRASFAFEEASGPVATDSSTYGHIGSIVGAAWTTGQIGGALAFDGSDDRVTVGATSALDLTATGTVEAWVRVDTLGRWHGIVAKGNTNDDAAHNYALEIGPSGMVVCVIGNGSAADVVRPPTAVSAGQFYHLACTWDGSAVRLYINGALDDSSAQTIVASANSAPLFIGQYGGDVDRMDGVIDEVRIYSVALSAAQIQTDMTTAIANVPGDTVAPVRSNGLPTGILAAGTTQATLRLTTDENATCRYGTVAGTAYTALATPFTTTSGTAHATTVSGLKNGRSYAYYVRCQDSAGNANATDFTINFSVAAGALRASFAFEEGSGPIAIDATEYGHVGNVVGAAWTADGRIGGALTFDGSDDRVTVGATSALDLTETGTVEAWVRFETVGQWHSVVAKGDSNVDMAHNYALVVDPRNAVMCVIGNGSAANAVRSATTMSAGQFYHLACTWDGSTIRLYINGALNNSAAQTIVAGANSAPLFIGQYGGDVDRVDGLIDEVRIYSVALSLAEIQSDMTGVSSSVAR